MPANYLFEYAVIRVVPRVEREEFLNVGIVLYCRQLQFLQTAFTLDEERLRAFSCTLDIAELRACLCSFEQICRGGEAGGPIGKLDMASRFRWLTATRSTVVQLSKVHPGLCEDAAETLEKLHRQLVL
ncbi:MAG: DUF3037 domain-containing protein [Puia sp.]|nr:DUF3037 domain-containing protein [Puia sp.]